MKMGSLSYRTNLGATNPEMESVGHLTLIINKFLFLQISKDLFNPASSKLSTKMIYN
jgi:hypothetical protein